jgi:ferritin
MKLSEKILRSLNKQMNEELFNSMTYFAMSSHANYMGFFGVESWLKAQALQELEHMRRFASYINDANYVLQVSTMTAPINLFDSLMDIFTAALEREEVTTRNCNDIRALAKEERDQNTEVFMDWFVNEQTEELAWANEYIAMLKVAGDNPAALFYFDNVLAEKV